MVVIIFWDFLAFYQCFFRHGVIISIKNSSYKLPHELPNNLMLQENPKSAWNYNLVASPLPKMKNLSIMVKNYKKLDIEPFP